MMPPANNRGVIDPDASISKWTIAKSFYSFGECDQTDQVTRERLARIGGVALTPWQIGQRASNAECVEDDDPRLKHK